LGSILFGVGWAASGTCPGTSLAQIGEGRFAGAITFLGILLGSYLAERTQNHKEKQKSEPIASPSGRAASV
jgi:uncharacterized membrane protein YedE/YeeE